MATPYGYIYAIANIANGKWYIGQTTRDVQTRWNEHTSAANTDKSNNHFHNAIRKFGGTSFIRIIIDVAFDKGELDDKERRWITFFASTNKDYGYNTTEGGNVVTMTDEVRHKISKANTGKTRSNKYKKWLSEHSRRKWNNPEYRTRECSRRRGAGNGFYGKHHTNSTKDKLRAAHLGKPACEYTKQRSSETATERWADPEFKKLMSEKRKALWQDPKYKAKVMEGRKLAHQRKLDAQGGVSSPALQSA